MSSGRNDNVYWALFVVTMAGMILFEVVWELLRLWWMGEL